MRDSWEAATKAQYDDDANLAARQALFNWLTSATPLPAPMSDMSMLEGQRVLDVGCGNGQWLALAARSGAVAVGSDLSFGMVQSAGAAADSPVVQSDAHRLPFADESIDVVLALWMIYHLDDKPAALAEMARVMRPNARLIASTNSGAPGRLDEIVIDALADQRDGPIEHWHAPLNFTSENGEAIMRTEFDDVMVHPFGNTFEVAEAEVLVRYVESMLGPIKAEHGDIDTEALLHRVGQTAQAEIATSDKITIERSGTVFIATK